jgi:photosystem II stability/assembly factor-like uncharacterized protein
MANATFIKSIDGGLSWQPKMKIDDKTTIAGVNVLTMAINPKNTSNIYIGTESGGIYMTKDGGESWVAVPFPQKVYGIAIDNQNPDNIYASGVFNGRAKIFKRSGETQEWKEIYTEPSNGTTISSLVISPINPQILYAGTSSGIIIKSTDGGQSWINLKKADGPVISIVFDGKNDRHIFFAIFQGAILETKDAGTSIEEFVQKNNDGKRISDVMTMVGDPFESGGIYVGTTSGIIKCLGNNTCSVLNIIESSKPFPIRAIALSLTSPKEIMYSSAKAIYKSIDGGIQWSTFQLDTNKEISILRYDPIDGKNIYAGFRSF